MSKIIRIFSSLAVFIAASFVPLRAHSVAELKEIEAKVKQLVAKNMPAVVSLMGESVPGAGSGTIVSADGLILTAAHVTRGNEKMTVVFPDGRSVKCKVLGANYTRDVGLAKIEGGGTYPFVEVGDSDKLSETTIVVGMGHPGGFDVRRTPPVRIGRINVKDLGGFLVSDCTLVGGDSGGPMFDLDGRIVGIHSSISESLSFNRDAPVSAAKQDWGKLLAGERWGSLSGEPRGDRKRAVIGAVLDTTTKDGVTLKAVEPKSPLAEAGIKAGDVIVKFGGGDVKNADELAVKIGKSKPGEKVELAYRRDGAEAIATITLISEAELMKRNESPGNEPRMRRRGRDRSAEPPPKPEVPKQP